MLMVNELKITSRELLELACQQTSKLTISKSFILLKHFFDLVCIIYFSHLFIEILKVENQIDVIHLHGLNIE